MNVDGVDGGKKKKWERDIERTKKMSNRAQHIIVTIETEKHNAQISSHTKYLQQLQKYA